MSDAFVAEMRMFPFNFAPKGWAFSDGQILPISQNTALFALLGTIYGGDGKSTFALPNLQDSCAIGSGQGPGLSYRDLGETGGTPSVTLIESEMPAHTHNLQGAIALATTSLPSNQTALAKSTGGSAYKKTPFGSTNFMSFQSLAPSGGDQPHNNMMPYLTLNICIALQGVFPSRN
jgi:microcystin-dependent protein